MKKILLELRSAFWRIPRDVALVASAAFFATGIIASLSAMHRAGQNGTESTGKIIALAVIGLLDCVFAIFLLRRASSPHNGDEVDESTPPEHHDIERD